MGVLDIAVKPSVVALAALLLASLISAAITRRRHTNGLPLPPGPPGEPFLGHLRLVPSSGPEYMYMKWSREYSSDVIFVNILGQPVVVINSVQAAVHLLDKNGINYSDRPRFILMEIMGWTKTLTFLQWGPEFRKHRRVLQQYFANSKIAQYSSIQQRETVTMLRGLLSKPTDWESIIRRMFSAVILGVGFGITIDSEKDPYIQVAADASYALGHIGAPAGTPVDFFPALRYMPRLFHDRLLKFANDWRWAVENLHNKPFDAVLSAKQHTNSLTRIMLDQRQAQLDKGETPDFGLDDIKGAGAAVFAAGQDTTCATIMTFVINMILQPEIQSRAQKVLDRAIGRERLPDISDRSNPDLRYIEFVMQETIRWHPVAPLGVPHRSIKADVYNGYYIPAGSLVCANAYAMTHDPSLYSTPDQFDPDRYTPIDEGGRGEPFPNGPFGFGRRVCIGQDFAKASIWTSIACILSTMEMKKPLDESGNEVTPEIKVTYGLTSHPTGFDCRFMPRDDKSADLIETMH